MAHEARAPAVDSNEDDVDSCGCDVEFHDSEATPDEELPPATGGVEAGSEEGADDEEVDGCDLDFAEVDLTSDEELPVAVGGM